MNAQCPRCRADVITVEQTPLRVDVDPHPAAAGDTAPYFRIAADGLARGRWVRSWPERTDGAHAVHHCPAPHRCRWCEQVHNPPTTVDGIDSNSSSKETAA